MLKKPLPLLLVFLIAFALRTYRLTEIPPGLTHDEANHGREAMGILDGDWHFYFPANYGSEPVYSYTVAGSMWAGGENLLALRLVNAFLGLGAMGVAYSWTARLFDRQTALLAAGLTAVSFWPVASSREALRAGMLPFFMATTVWFFWQIITTRSPDKTNDEPANLSITGTAVAFGVTIAITLHIYLAARMAWLIFPVFLIYLALLHRAKFRVAWRPVLAGLVLAGLLVIPMFVYLQNNPEAQTRLSMLDGPLQGLRDGQIAPILGNAAEALLAFVWPGYGDQFLAYNIPGRPVFDGITAVFFIVGLVITLWRWRQPRYAFLLLWFVIGIMPSLLTGATANTTRNLAALTAVMLLPALGFTAVTSWILKRLWTRDWRLNAGQSPSSNLQSPLAITAMVWLLFAGFTTARDYFYRWGESTAVRGAYQHTLAAELAYLAETPAALPTVISTVYPGPAHDPSIGQVLAPQADPDRRWLDARYALLFPHGGSSRLVIPTSTPLHPAWTTFVRPVTAVSLRPDDLDPGFTIYDLDASRLALGDGETAVNFDDAVTLRAAWWLTPSTPLGETAELLTIWQVIDPARVGPLVPPFGATDAAIFVHVLDEAGHAFAQDDRLDAPSWDWQTGDVLLQIHPVIIPPETVPGSYQTIVGLYDRLSGDRRRVINAAGAAGDTFAFVPPLQISDS